MILHELVRLGRVLNLPDWSRLARSYEWIGRACLFVFCFYFYYKVGCQVLFAESGASLESRPRERQGHCAVTVVSDLRKL